MTLPWPGRRRLPRPLLMLVTDRSLCGGADGLVNAVAAAVAGGVNVVQLREKDLSDAEQAALAYRLRDAIGSKALLVVNDRTAVALSAGADGVHGGEASLPVDMMRREVAGRLLIGRSVHSVPAAVAAARSGADYLVAGTVFPSRSHPGQATGGVERVRQIVAAVPIPVIAIGGITAENAADVVHAGAAGVAVIAAILTGRNAQAAATDLRAALNAAVHAASAVAGTAAGGST